MFVQGRPCLQGRGVRPHVRPTSRHDVPATMFESRDDVPGTTFESRYDVPATMFESRDNVPGTMFVQGGGCLSRDDVRPGTMFVQGRRSPRDDAHAYAYVQGHMYAQAQCLDVVPHDV